MAWTLGEYTTNVDVLKNQAVSAEDIADGNYLVEPVFVAPYTYMAANEVIITDREVTTDEVLLNILPQDKKDDQGTTKGKTTLILPKTGNTMVLPYVLLGLGAFAIAGEGLRRKNKR